MSFFGVFAAEAASWFNGRAAAMARLFFAVGVSREVSAALHTLSLGLRHGPVAACLRFTDIEQAHYTLRFLGEQPPARQAAALRLGRAAAALSSAFDLELDGLGVFPDDRRPHTLWIGAGKGASDLAHLAGLLESGLVAEGFSPEERPFVPHLTLARVKQRPEAGAIAALLAEPRAAIGPSRVETFTLMESRPQKGGVRYIALETFALELPCMPSKSPSPAAPK